MAARARSSGIRGVPVRGLVKVTLRDGRTVAGSRPVTALCGGAATGARASPPSWPQGAEVRCCYQVIATRSAATRIRHIPGVIRSTQMPWPQLITADGLIGCGLYANLTGRTLETLTVWHDRASMTAFVRGRQHTALVDRTRHRIRDTGS